MRVDRLFSSTSLDGRGRGVFDTHSSATGLPEHARRLRQKGNARFRAIINGENLVAKARGEAAKADQAFNDAIVGAIGTTGQFLEAGQQVARTLRENETKARRHALAIETEARFDAQVGELPRLLNGLGVAGFDYEHAFKEGVGQIRDHALGQIVDEDDRAALAPRFALKEQEAMAGATRDAYQRSVTYQRGLVDKVTGGLGARAAGAADTSVHFNNIQEGLIEIDRGRAAGLFDPASAERRKTAFRTAYVNAMLRTSIERDPNAVIQALDGGGFDAFFGDDGAAADGGAGRLWRTEAQRVAKQREVETAAQAREAAHDEMTTHTERVRLGDLSRDGIKELGLRKADEKFLLARADARDAEVEMLQRALGDADALRDGKGPKPGTPEYAAAVEQDYIVASMGHLAQPNEKTPQVLADTAERLNGEVPEFVIEQIVETFAGGAPEHQAIAAKALVELGLVGNAVTSRVAPRDAALAFTMNDLLRAGNDPADAARMAREALAPDANQKAARQEDLDAGDYDASKEPWLQAQEKPGGLIARRNAALKVRDGEGAQVQDSATLRAAFEPRFARAYLLTGNVRVAREMALLGAMGDARNLDIVGGEDDAPALGNSNEDRVEESGPVQGSEPLQNLSDQGAEEDDSFGGRLLRGYNRAVQGYVAGKQAQAEAGKPIARGVAGGARDAVQNGILAPVNALSSLWDGKELTLPDVPSDPNNQVEMGVRKATQFLIGFIPAVRAIRVVAGTAATGAGLIARASAADVITNLTVFDGQEENLFDMWNDLGLPRNVLTDYLTDKSGSEGEGRVKNALASVLEGAAGGAIAKGTSLSAEALVEGVTLAARVVRNSRRIRMERREIGHLYDAAVQDPSGKTVGKASASYVDIDLDELDDKLSKVVVDLGKSDLAEDGSVSLKSSFGMVKVVWKHGERSSDTQKVTKEDLLKIPKLMRDYQWTEAVDDGGRVSRTWTVDTGEDRRVHYVARLFDDGENHLLSVYVLKPSNRPPISLKRK